MPMPRSSASRGLPSDSRSSVPAELAGVGTDDAGEDLQQRRLAGAVLADERVRLAFADAKVTPVSAFTAPNDLRTSWNSSPGMQKAPPSYYAPAAQ